MVQAWSYSHNQGPLLESFIGCRSGDSRTRPMTWVCALGYFLMKDNPKAMTGQFGTQLETGLAESHADGLLMPPLPMRSGLINA